MSKENWDQVIDISETINDKIFDITDSFISLFAVASVFCYLKIKSNLNAPPYVNYLLGFLLADWILACFIISALNKRK